MTQLHKKIIGMTMLEILLTLLIISATIILSVRYYQGAQAAVRQQSVLNKIKGIHAAVNAFAARRSQGYADFDENKIRAYLPENGLTTEWGGTIDVDGLNKTTYEVFYYKMPVAACNEIKGILNRDAAHYIFVGCDSSPYLRYQYKK